MKISELQETVQELLGERLLKSRVHVGELTIEVAPADLYDVCRLLRDDRQVMFEQLIDLCGVDYSAYGVAEWETEQASGSGYSRGVDATSGARLGVLDEELSVETGGGSRRFAVVYHLLSVTRNHRLRVRVYVADDELPVVPSVLDIWSSANWYEREAFDLYGILFDGHPDLRRILTDYGFIGHPFRKDFPLTGNVEVRFDPEKNRVVYEPVSIEPRVLVPRVIRAAGGEERAEQE
jgi:NADH-quinone oxidoreductase subunit C